MIARSILTPGLPALLFFLTSARAQVDHSEVSCTTKWSLLIMIMLQHHPPRLRSRASSP
jgi:cytochrome c oxidase subunit IV